MSLIWVIVILFVGYNWGYASATISLKKKAELDTENLSENLRRKHQAERLKWVGYKKNGEY